MIHWEQALVTEPAARHFLLHLCAEHGGACCPRCRFWKIYRLAGGRRRCAQCRYTFTAFTGHWLDWGNVRCLHWLKIIQALAAETPVRQMAQELGLAYRTVYKAVTAVRWAIVAHGHQGSQWVETLRRTAGHGLVYGLRAQKEKAEFELVAEMTPEEVWTMPLAKIVRGCLVYTDSYDGYDGLVAFVGWHDRDRLRGVGLGVHVRFEGLRELHDFVRQRRLKRAMATPLQHALFLKEMEFRYNHRREDVTELLLQYVCDVEPPGTRVERTDKTGE